MDKKELKRVLKALEEQGFEVRTTSKMHVQVRKDGRPVASFAGTPSDWRSFKNSLAQARRAGFVWGR